MIKLQTTLPNCGLPPTIETAKYLPTDIVEIVGGSKMEYRNCFQAIDGLFYADESHFEQWQKDYYGVLDEIKDEIASWIDSLQEEPPEWIYEDVLDSGWTIEEGCIFNERLTAALKDNSDFSDLSDAQIKEIVEHHDTSHCEAVTSVHYNQIELEQLGDTEREGELPLYIIMQHVVENCDLISRDIDGDNEQLIAVVRSILNDIDDDFHPTKGDVFRLVYYVCEVGYVVMEECDIQEYIDENFTCLDHIKLPADFVVTIADVIHAGGCREGILELLELLGMEEPTTARECFNVGLSFEQLKTFSSNEGSDFCLQNKEHLEGTLESAIERLGWKHWDNYKWLYSFVDRYYDFRKV